MEDPESIEEAETDDYADWPEEVRKQHEEYMAVLSSTPPWFVRWPSWLLWGIFAFSAALTVIVQWAAWFLVTIQLWNPWGAGIGIGVAAAQMLMIFTNPRPKETCEIPR